MPTAPLRHTLQRAAAFTALAAALACADEATGSVSLRVYAAAGPNPLTDVELLRLGLVGGDAVTLSADSAFDLSDIGLNGAVGVRQVSLEGLAADGQVLARGVSRPETFDSQENTVVDLVLRRAEAFSAGLSPADVGDAVPSITLGPAAGDPVLLVGEGGILLIDPWLVAPKATLLESTYAALQSFLASRPHALPLGSDKGWVLVSQAGCVPIHLEGGWLMQGPMQECLGSEELLPDASWLRLDDGSASQSKWLVAGGRAGQGAAAACRLVTASAESVLVQECADLAAPRVRPLLAFAGDRVVIAGGTTASGSPSANPVWGELRFGAAIDAGVEALVAGPARGPSDGASYGGDSAVFVGDGSALVYAVVGGTLGTAGALGRARAGSALAVLADGRLLVAGGRSDDSAVSADLLQLDSTGTFEFEKEVSILVPRSDARLVALAAGTMLAGGVDYGGTTPSSIIEVFVAR